MKRRTQFFFAALVCLCFLCVPCVGTVSAQTSLYTPGEAVSYCPCESCDCPGVCDCATQFPVGLSHSHQCPNPRCGYVWTHDGALAASDPYAHNCPRCGTYQNEVYSGTLTGVMHPIQYRFATQGGCENGSCQMTTNFKAAPRLYVSAPDAIYSPGQFATNFSAGASGAQSYAIQTRARTSIDVQTSSGGFFGTNPGPVRRAITLPFRIVRRVLGG